MNWRSIPVSAGLSAGLLLVLCPPANAAEHPPTPEASPARAEPQCAQAVAFDGEVPETPEGLARAHRLATGAGVRVAVIDTGVSPHPRLGQVIDGGDLVDPTGAGGGALRDCDGHGTVVAGVLAARADDGGRGPVGVAPDAEVLSIRQSSARFRELDDSPVGTVGSLAAAIDRAVEQQAQVISISVVACVPADTAVTLDTTTLDTALARAEAARVVVVAAAGNVSPGCEPGSVVYPTHADTVVTVAGHHSPHHVADYSLPAPGSRVLSAPGHHAIGLSPHGAGLASGLAGEQGPVAFEGTSFAAPVVAGAAALLRQRHPQLSAAAIRELLYDSTDPATGALDPYRAVSHLAGSQPQPASPPEISARVPAEPVAGRRSQGLVAGLVLGMVLVAGLIGLIRGHRNGA